MNTIKYLKRSLFLIALIGLLVVFTGCKEDIVPPADVDVTGITVTGTDDAIIVYNGQTLQMIADVLPVDATDKSVTWSVVEDAGTATIDQDGLLTGGTTTGIVTVKATANDGSAIEGTKEVTVTAPAVITTTAIPGVIEPVTGETPDTTAIDTLQYTGTVAWSPSDSSYLFNTAYTATITLTPKAGFTLTGVTAFTVAGATVTYVADSDVMTALFPVTTEATINIAAIPGVIAPVTGETPDTTAIDTPQYTVGTVVWTPVVADTYLAETVYTATITLTAKTGFTLTGVGVDFFTVEGATATNAVDAGVVAAVFPETAAAVVGAITLVDLGTAGGFAILAKSGITTTGTTAIIGDLGISPEATTAITGFTLAAADPVDLSYQTSTFVTGKIYASDMGDPTPSNLIQTIMDMEAAYTDTAGRPTTPNVSGGQTYLNLLGGTIGGETLAPGVYTWGSAVNIASDITLDGSATDIWILKMTGALNLAASTNVLLINGAKAENVFWQVAGAVSFLESSQMEGTILGKAVIALESGASINGKMLSQENVTLISNIVTDPTYTP